MRGALAQAALIVAATAGVARADRPGFGGAKLVAEAWMNAPAKSPPALADAVALTAVPFWYEGAVYLDRGSSKTCAKVGARGTVTDAVAVGPVLDCLRHGTAPLLDAVETWTAVDLQALPAPLARYRAKLVELARTQTLVLAHAKAKKTEDWAVMAVRADGDAAVVSAFVAAHTGR